MKEKFYLEKLRVWTLNFGFEPRVLIWGENSEHLNIRVC
jgi:hypothetical protein